MRILRVVAGGAAGLGLVGAGVAGIGGKDDTVRNDQGEVVEGGEVGAFRIRLGDCLLAMPGEQFESASAVPCDQPHAAEVYEAFNMADGTFPGDAPISAEADRRCGAAFEPFVGVAFEDSEFDVAYTFPTPESWEQLDDREVLCLLTTTSGAPTSGSARGAGR
jgi:Septum formation